MCGDTKTADRGEDLLTLYEELEGRYGLDLAQKIIDEIRKAENPAHVPGYMAVKAVSEVVELIRPLTRESLNRLKSARQGEDALPAGIADLEAIRRARAFTRLYRAYRLAQATFFDLYHRAMADVQKRRYVPAHALVNAQTALSKRRMIRGGV